MDQTPVEGFSDDDDDFIPPLPEDETDEIDDDALTAIEANTLYDPELEGQAGLT